MFTTRRLIQILLLGLFVLTLILFVSFYDVTTISELYNPPEELVVKSSYHNEEYTKVKFENQNLTHADVMIISSIAGPDSYGKDRSFTSLFNTLKGLRNHKYTYSFGFLLSSKEEFDKVEEFIELQSWTNTSRIVLLYAPFLEKTFLVDGGSRHDDNIQRDRRRLIARVRNFLVLNALESETYTLSVDADIYQFKDAWGVLPTFIESGLDIIVPRIIRGGDHDYDKNSWRGERTKPSEEQLLKLDAKESIDYVPRDVPDRMYHFEDYMKNDNELEAHINDHKYAFPLDSVGGAVLFVKSVIFKQGIIFPTSYVVGATWDRTEGYDGIETEGLCYLAKPAGYSCWGMPNQLGYHVDR